MEGARVHIKLFEWKKRPTSDHTRLSRRYPKKIGSTCGKIARLEEQLWDIHTADGRVEVQPLTAGIARTPELDGQAERS